MSEEKKKTEKYANPNWFVGNSVGEISDYTRAIHRNSRDDENKYIYYLIALCVASIGFTVSKTFKEPLSLTQILLGMALFLWFLSINSGLKALRTHISRLQNLAEGNMVISGVKRFDNKEERISASEILHDKDKKFEDSLKKSFRFQGIYFLVGVGIYMVWRILEMALLNPKVVAFLPQWLS